MPLMDPNPLNWLGDQAKQSLADGFTSMMMGLWSAAMWLLDTTFDLIDSFTPNVDDPNLSQLYSITLWLATVTALCVAFVQIGLAVVRRSGTGFGNLASGIVQYGVVMTCWVGVCAGVISGCSGLTRGILRTLLGVDSFSGYAASDGFVHVVSGTVQATVLGVCAVFLVIPAAFGHMVIMLVRSAALLILTATLPITAAGALSEGTRQWMWKSIRWFLACALMEPLMALVLGLGTQFAWAGMPDARAASGSSTAQDIGTSVVGSVILLVSCFAPMALFRLFAFVDPGTASGASFRSTLSASGGVSGLLTGRALGRPDAGMKGQDPGSSSASDGRTSSENGAEAATSHRWQTIQLARAGGLVGSAVEATGRLASVSTSVAIDVLGQSGIGNQGYYDVSGDPGRAARRNHRAHRLRPLNDENGDGIANDLPTQAQGAVEEGAFFA